MVDLYGYDNASYEQCIDDLNEVLESLQSDTYVDCYDNDADTLERKGQRIQYIAQRLRDLEK